MVPTQFAVREQVSLQVCQTEKFKAESISLSLVLPLEEERYLTTLLFSVLLRGCEHYPTQRAINRRLDELYGTAVSVRDYTVGEAHVVGLYADFVSASYLPAGSGEEVFSETLAMLRDLLLFPRLDADGCLHAAYVESEKRLQCDAIRARKNSPRGYALERARALMLAGHPAGASYLGSVEEVEAVTPARLTEHWRWLISHGVAHCFYVGGCEGGYVADLLGRTLQGVRIGHMAGKAPAAFCAPLPARDPAWHGESLAVSQGQLVLGYRFACTPDGRRYFAATMLYELLGASPVSKLFVNVRERLGICYTCNAQISPYTGTLFVTAGIAARNRDAAERAIGEELAALASGKITDEEWEAAQQSRLNALTQINDNPSGLDRFYTNRSIMGVTLTPEDERTAILSLSREEVVELARACTLDTVFFLEPTREGCDDDED